MDEKKKESVYMVLWILTVVFLVFNAFAFAKKTKESEVVMGEPIEITGGRYEIINEYTQSDDIEESIHYYVAYDKVTKVIYTIGKASGSSPTFTVMVGPTGTPIIYSDANEETEDNKDN